jgi:hypothetical protein
MKFLLSASMLSCLFLCSCQNSNDVKGGTGSNFEFSAVDFEKLLHQVAEGWNEGNAQKAAECFSIDAIYIEPPDRQLMSRCLYRAIFVPLLPKGYCSKIGRLFL